MKFSVQLQNEDINLPNSVAVSNLFPHKSYISFVHNYFLGASRISIKTQ